MLLHQLGSKLTDCEQTGKRVSPVYIVEFSGGGGIYDVCLFRVGIL